MTNLEKGVLVVADQRDGTFNRVSFEALAAGMELASTLGVACAAMVLGRELGDLPSQLAAQGPAQVLSIHHDLLASYTADGFVHALEQAIRKVQPAFVVFPHTYQVRDYAPALATRFRESLISDVIAIKPGPVFVRQLLQGKLSGEYRHTFGSPCFVSVQAGSFRAPASPAEGTPGEIVPMQVDLEAKQIRSKAGERFRESAQTVDLTAAPLIVSVGRGIREQENISLVEELAAALGAEIAASRPICDSGWLPMERQVGSSGQTVSPKLYLAVGISGAIQHLVGMKGSKAIIAINKDANAPIFEVADVGVVGDLFEIVPALTKAIAASKS